MYRITAVTLAVVVAGGSLVGTMGSATGIGQRTMRPTWAAKGFDGYFDQVAGVPHSSDVFGVAEDERPSASDGTAVVLRRHGKWHTVKHPGSAATVTSAGVKATWMGGSRQASYEEPVIAQWNGAKFIAQHVPATSGLVEDIAASSSSNAWASGQISTATSSVVEHWDGHKWSAVPVPTTDQLSNIATSSASNALAIDANDDDAGIAVLRWNGTTWSQSLSAAPDVTLTGVATASADDGIVVGYRTESTGRRHTYVARFDGKTWTHITTPNVLHSAALFSVSGHGEVLWAIGSGNRSNGSEGTLILHSTNGGKTWKSQHSPTQGVTDFDSVSAVSKTLAYLGGAHRATTDSYPKTTFAEFNGHSWKAQPSTL